jgi:hypothetical protein
MMIRIWKTTRGRNRQHKDKRERDESRIKVTSPGTYVKAAEEVRKVDGKVI